MKMHLGNFETVRARVRCYAIDEVFRMLLELKCRRELGLL